MSFMRTAAQTALQDCASQASRQRQVIDNLAKDYDRQLHDVLRHRELMKGSVYEMKTRCGESTCHCARPAGGLHSEWAFNSCPTTVLSWSEHSKTCIRSLAAGDQARIRSLTENHRRLRQSRLALTKLHREILAAVGRLEQAMLVPPPPPARGVKRQRAFNSCPRT